MLIFDDDNVFRVRFAIKSGTFAIKTSFKNGMTNYQENFNNPSFFKDVNFYTCEQEGNYCFQNLPSVIIKENTSISTIARSFSGAWFKAHQVFYHLKSTSKSKIPFTNTEDKGDFATTIIYDVEAIETELHVTRKSGYNPCDCISVAMDVNRLNFYPKNGFVIQFFHLTEERLNYNEIFGERIKRCVSNTETLIFRHIHVSNSHTSIAEPHNRETEDATNAILTVTLNCGQIKTGSAQRCDTIAENNYQHIKSDAGKCKRFSRNECFTFNLF
jgi:enolase